MINIHRGNALELNRRVKWFTENMRCAEILKLIAILLIIVGADMRAVEAIKYLVRAAEMGQYQ